MTKRIYTRKGDQGETDLLSGERVGKDDPRVEAYGTVDELIAVLGLAKTYVPERISGHIHSIQELLFLVAAELAIGGQEKTATNELGSKLRKVAPDDVSSLERVADELSDELPLLSSFVIPGGQTGAAFLHQARTVCRRAERRVLTLSRHYPINQEILRYLDRLSDLLFVMARHMNLESGDGEHLISRNGVKKQVKKPR
ncbi:MAG: cob(I)yrinic acid a,c-diamide adenosyltransferase [Candidatus Thorarchaeota archaeon]|nr:MAG: cob(I)yrinic acid a,c-diamide adenosyltransferase [Candidatus Thorarchaeota archaeon]